MSLARSVTVPSSALCCSIWSWAAHRSDRAGRQVRAAERREVQALVIGVEGRASVDVAAADEPLDFLRRLDRRGIGERVAESDTD